jgi:hypothetical protein
VWKFAGSARPSVRQERRTPPVDLEIIRRRYVPVVARYPVNEVDTPKVVGEIADILDRLARDGARLMLERALSAEVDEFLGRERYARGGGFRGYRNGYARPRTAGSGPGRSR